MADAYKTLWGYMHQEESDEFYTGKRKFLPLSFIAVILYRKSNRVFIHSKNTVITDSNAVGIFSKVINHGLCPVEGFLTVWYPAHGITGINQLLKNIMIAVLFGGTIKNEFIIFPQLFQFLQIFSAEHFGNDPDGKKKV